VANRRFIGIEDLDVFQHAFDFIPTYASLLDDLDVPITPGGCGERRFNQWLVDGLVYNQDHNDIDMDYSLIDAHRQDESYQYIVSENTYDDKLFSLGILVPLYEGEHVLCQGIEHYYHQRIRFYLAEISKEFRNHVNPEVNVDLRDMTANHLVHQSIYNPLDLTNITTSFELKFIVMIGKMAIIFRHLYRNREFDVITNFLKDIRDDTTYTELLEIADRVYTYFQQHLPIMTDTVSLMSSVSREYIQLGNTFESDAFRQYEDYRVTENIVFNNFDFD
jgi:hypothetical protein